MPLKDPEKLKAYKAQWYLCNREKVRARGMAYRVANREALIAHDREYYRVNRGEILRKTKERKLENLEHFRAIARLHYHRTKYKDQNAIRRIHVGMIGRCRDIRNPAYYNYGGRGITVCKEWLALEVFRVWASSNGWKPGLEIDRIDNDGNYEPSNCRFVTRMVNTQKRRTSKLTLSDAVEIKRLLHDGNLQRDIAEMFGISRRFVSNIKTGDCWRNAA